MRFHRLAKKVYTWNVSTQSVDSIKEINRFKFDWLLVCKRAAPLPLCQIQARVALTLFEKLDQGPEISKIDGAQEYLDILTRYEMLKFKGLAKCHR